VEIIAAPSKGVIIPHHCLQIIFINKAPEWYLSLHFVKISSVTICASASVSSRFATAIILKFVGLGLQRSR